MRSRSLVVAMVVIGGHRRLRADMGEQLGGDPLVLGQDLVGTAQAFGGARLRSARLPIGVATI